jgi:H+/Cl- antiporter ClcA
VLTGLVVAGFDRLTGRALFDHVFTGPLWLQAIGPLAGLLLGSFVLRWFAFGASPSTSDEYIRNFHQQDQRLPLWPVPGKVLASVATLGPGAPVILLLGMRAVASALWPEAGWVACLCRSS